MFAVYEFNSRSCVTKLVCLHTDIHDAFDEAECLNRETPMHKMYYISNEGIKLEDAINKKVINICEVVAQCLYLFDTFMKKKGKTDKALALYNLALHHCKRASQYLPDDNF